MLELKKILTHRGQISFVLPSSSNIVSSLAFQNVVVVVHVIVLSIDLKGENQGWREGDIIRWAIYGISWIGLQAAIRGCTEKRMICIHCHTIVGIQKIAVVCKKLKSMAEKNDIISGSNVPNVQQFLFCYRFCFILHSTSQIQNISGITQKPSST